MLLTFYYEGHIEAGHDQDIGIHTTFGEAIDRFCAETGIRNRDWMFAWSALHWENNWVRQQDRTPHELDLTDADEVFVLCVPCRANN